MAKCKSAFATLALALATAHFAQATNLVTNGGFETGDQTGWVIVPAASGSFYGISTNAHQGAWSAAFGALSGLDDTLYQDVATTPGAEYTLTFWLDASQWVSGHFASSIGGTTVLDTGYVPGGFLEHSYIFTAESTSTRLAFMGNAPPIPGMPLTFYYLDDVSVSAVPEPPAVLLTLLGLGWLAKARNRRRTWEATPHDRRPSRRNHNTAAGSTHPREPARNIARMAERSEHRSLPHR